MIKLLAFKYPTTVDVSLNREVKPVFHSDNGENIQEFIKKLLFVNGFNYLLIALDSELYICEPTGVDRVYSRRKICYHPSMNEFHK